MKGLEICEKYFEEFGAPMVEQKFPEYKQRIAAGLVGDGSECFGFDDELSRDHDWGPSFCLWLNKEDYKIIGKSLQAEVEKLPKSFMGFERKVSDWGGGRTGLFEIGNFYKSFIGFDHVPNSINEWLAIPEDYLAIATNGKVFADPLDEFTQFRNELKEYYPEDVRLKRIAARCMTIAQYGQYNFIRCIKREEYVAALYAESKFCEDTISLVFLLNKEYKPFFKWMHRAVKRLPIMGYFVHRILREIVTTNDYEKKSRLMETICGRIVKELQKQRLSDSSSSFLLDHGPVIQKRIQNAELRNRNVWLD